MSRFVVTILLVLFMAGCGSVDEEYCNFTEAIMLLEEQIDSFQATINKQNHKIADTECFIENTKLTTETAEAQNPIDYFFNNFSNDFDRLHIGTFTMIWHSTLIANVWRAEVAHLQTILLEATWSDQAKYNINELVRLAPKLYTTPHTLKQ